MSDQACCACIHVVHEILHHSDGTCSEAWACRDCHHKFVKRVEPKPDKLALPDWEVLAREYEKRVGDLGRMLALALEVVEAAKALGPRQCVCEPSSGCRRAILDAALARFEASDAE